MANKGPGALTCVFKIKAYPIQQDDDGRWFIPSGRNPEFIQLNMTTICDIPFERITAKRSKKPFNLIRINLKGKDYGIDEKAYNTSNPLINAIFGFQDPRP